MSVRAQRLPVYATLSPEAAQQQADHTRNGRYDLTPAEVFWRDRQPFLQTRGYRLRPRYCPGWTPSWLGTNRDPLYCDDALLLHEYHVIDATRDSDGLRVAIKRAPTETNEIPMAVSLTTPELLQVPNNHCVPVLDVFVDPYDSSISHMVMPFVRSCNDPEFCAIGEVVDFVKQTLEGMCFLHAQRVVHRDCAAANIMMDGRALYPQGYHPVRQKYSEDVIYKLTPLSRLDHPVRYYFIDFEFSVRIPAGGSPFLVGTMGRDKTVPELSSDVPYDAFKVDIYALGNVYNKEFLQKYHGLEFLNSLVDAMKATDPTERPSAEAALEMFEEICHGLNDTLLRWRLRPHTESTPVRVVWDTVAVAREGLHQFKRLVS